MQPITFLTHLYNSCMKGFVFPIFSSLDLSSLHPFNQPITLQPCPTVPTGPNARKHSFGQQETSLHH
jgi:hypothetical protein